MQTLVLNGGSSSIKFSLFDSDRDDRPTVFGHGATCLLNGELTGIGSRDSVLKVSLNQEPFAPNEGTVDAITVEQAIHAVLEAVGQCKMEPDAVGYRVVHPGPDLHGHQRITPEVLQLLEKAVDFAPLHGRETVTLIRETMRRFSAIPHYACFDTVFHETMHAEASTYPLPLVYRDAGVRRYGFHGLSCESIVRQMSVDGTLPMRMVIAHLGSGCSVTALVDGLSVDTTMGLTPTGGVVMGTRSGDLDPGLVLYLLRLQDGDRAEAVDAVESLLNHASGIASLSAMANDVKAVRAAARQGNPQASLALKVFTRSITKAVGGFCWLLGGLDAIVFTGGVGQHDPQTREEILSGLKPLGIELDSARNRAAEEGLRRISSTASQVAVLVGPALEDLIIALHVEEMYRSDKEFIH
jgi:acetate kinase